MGAKGRLTRFLAGLLCLCMVFSLTDGVFGGVRALAAEGLPEASPTGPETNEAPAAEAEVMDDHSPYHTIGETADVSRVADPETMDSYKDALLGGGADGTSTVFGTRNAGRLWADKSVFAYGRTNGDFDGNTNKLTLNTEWDGVNGSVSLTNSLSGEDEDFLHVFSVLSSSQQYIGVPPSAVTIVIDNSGSMYSNNDIWEKTRISQTVTAVNTAIDSLMRAGPYNKVSVVLFGNGGTSTGYDVKATNKDTAVEIIPMGHYATSAEGTKPLEYLQARWSDYVEDQGGVLTPKTETGAEKKESGYVFVDWKALLGENYKGDSRYPYKDARRYDHYQNGTTNIQAGIYKGFQTLLAADKVKVIDGSSFSYIPSLVVLTDGNATDMLQGTYLAPELEAVGFTNDTGDKQRSFLVQAKTYEFNADGTTKKDSTDDAWNLFVGAFENDPRFGGEYTFRQFGYDNDNDRKTYPQSEDAQQEMIDLAHDERTTQAAMILSTLMTASYYKTATSKAYGEDCNVFTISVDMKNPADIDEAAVGEHTYISLNGNAITTNGPTMNPNAFFNKQWLVDKGYVVDPKGATMSGDAITTAYDETFKNTNPKVSSGELTELIGGAKGEDYTIGGQVIRGIYDAVDTFEAWAADGEETVPSLIYRPWQEVKGTLALLHRGKVTPDGPESERTETDDEANRRIEENWGKEPVEGSDEEKLRENIASHLGMTTDEMKELVPKVIKGPNHNNAYVVGKQHTVEFPQISDNVYGVTKEDVVNNINYVNEGGAYYPRSSDEAGNDIQDAFNTIVAEINEPVKTPVGGSNDAGVDDALVYSDPIGDYMEVKDVDSLLLYGCMLPLTPTFVYDYKWNDAYMTSPSTVGDHGGEFTDAWYKETIKDGVSEYDVKIDPTHNKDDAQAKTYWADSYVYRVGFSMAQQFVPTLETKPSVGELEEEQKNTVYIAYRFQLPEDVRNTWVLNPAYKDKLEKQLDDGKKLEYVTKDGSTFGYFLSEDSVKALHLDEPGAKVPDGVFKLSDIRVWVECTGDYNDDKGGLVSTQYDEALRVNIPAAAIPLQVATVTLVEEEGTDRDSRRFSTNLGGDNPGDEQTKYYEQSTPMRLFYTVGMKDEVRLATGEIVPSRLSQTYLDEHKNKDDARIWFLSNYYSGTRYNGYVESEDGLTSRDPVVTFGAAADNRYYLFEQPAILYAAADGSNQSGDVVSDESDDSGNVVEATVGTATIRPVTEAKDLTADGWYYFLFNYYVPNDDGETAAVKRYATARKGEEFGVGRENHADVESQLCWFDRTTGDVKDYDADGVNGGKPTEPDGANWVLAIRAGGLRVGDLSQNFTGKKANPTATTNSCFLPTVSRSSTADNVTVNVYLGNNGRLTVEDTLLLVTKTVASNSTVDANEEFKVQVFLDGVSGQREAIRVQYDPYMGLWRRRLASIDVLTDNAGYLCFSDGEYAKAMPSSGYEDMIILAPGDQFYDLGYYIYVGTDGPDTQTKTLYRADENGPVTGRRRR